MNSNLKLFVKKVLINDSEYKIGFFKRIKALTKTFSVKEYLIYDFDKNDISDYISDFQRLKFRELNGIYKSVADSQVLFTLFFQQNVNVPPVIGYMNEGLFFDIYSGENLKYSKIIEKIKKYKSVYIKPLGAGGGMGVFKVVYNKGIFYIESNEISSKELIKKITKMKDAIITKEIKQSLFSSSLNPTSTNTMRICIGRNKKSSKYEILGAVQRIGTNKSKSIDNFSLGGLAAEIDIETGEIGIMGIKYPKSKGNTFTHHPDSGKKITGLVIPNWETIKIQILVLSEKYPYIKFFAWDILLTDEGICALELNASSGMNMFQVTSGKRNEKIGNFFREHGVLK